MFLLVLKLLLGMLKQVIKNFGNNESVLYLAYTVANSYRPSSAVSVKIPGGLVVAFCNKNSATLRLGGWQQLEL